MLKRVSLGILIVLLVLLLIPPLLLAVPIGLVIYSVGCLVEKWNGEAAWARQHRRWMERERPPLADAEFLRAVEAQPGDAALWLAVRGAMAESMGLPPEAIQPADRFADLWRLLCGTWIGPDILDFVFRVERRLGVKIQRPVIDRIGKGLDGDQTADFEQFARSWVHEIRVSNPDASIDPGKANRHKPGHKSS